MKNVFYKLSVIFPEEVDIILQTPGKILNVENENTVCSTMLSKEPIWTMMCRSDLRRRTHSTVDDKMFVVISLEGVEDQYTHQYQTQWFVQAQPCCRL